MAPSQSRASSAAKLARGEKIKRGGSLLGAFLAAKVVAAQVNVQTAREEVNKKGRERESCSAQVEAAVWRSRLVRRLRNKVMTRRKLGHSSGGDFSAKRSDGKRREVARRKIETVAREEEAPRNKSARQQCADKLAR